MLCLVAKVVQACKLESAEICLTTVRVCLTLLGCVRGPGYGDNFMSHEQKTHCKQNAFYLVGRGPSTERRGGRF